MFSYNEISVEQNINEYVRKFWILNNQSNTIVTEPKYALPNGCFTLAFIIGNGVIVQSNKQSYNLPQGIYFSGQISKRLGIIIKPNTKAIMVQLSPWSGGIITNSSLHELTDNIMDLSLINKFLYTQLKDIDYNNEYVLIPKFYKCFEALLSSARPSLIKDVVGLFTNTTLPIRQVDIASSIGYSQRYLEKKFKNEVGLSPCEFYLILKLRSAITGLEDLSKESSIGMLAYQYGYFDQSHFIKSYYKVMNSQPKKFNSDDYILPFKI